MKKLSIVLLLILVVVLVIGCASNTENPAVNESTNEVDETSESKESVDSSQEEDDELVEKELELTLGELAEFDGKDGKPAYVAVEGVIYDVTDVYAWIDGKHNGVVAGQDITDALMNQSPHGPSKLSLATKVGILVEE